MKSLRSIKVSRWLSFIGILFLLFSSSLSGYAQAASTIVVEGIETSQFPQVDIYFYALDSANDPIQGIAAPQVTIDEDGTSLILQDLSWEQPGLEVYIAWNVSPNMAFIPRTVTRFEELQGVLQEWAAYLPSGTHDQYTITTNEGTLASGLSSPVDLAAAMAAYQPNLEIAMPSLNSLTQALELAADATPYPYMRRAILLITPTPTSEMIRGLPDLIDRAVELGVPIFVWMVGPVSAGSGQEADVWRQMAERTGGDFFLYSGEETMPNLETYFNPLRNHYHAVYQSEINESGSHAITVNVQMPDGQIRSEEQTYPITIFLPNPILLSPPSTIERAWQRGEGGMLGSMQPAEITLDFIVEFQDQHTRDIQTARLLVDGEVVTETSQEPFGSITWDLSGITTSGTYSLQVQVEDTLGLVGQTLALPVTITVEEHTPTLWENLSLVPWQVLIIVLAAGLALTTALLISRQKLLKNRPNRRADMDPVTQPVLVRMEQRRPSAGQERMTVPRPAPLRPRGSARLIRLDSETRQPIPNSVIVVSKPEITFGSDPRRAEFVLDSPSVSGLHARLRQTGTGNFMIIDEGSIAGTWINYAPISNQGARLESGDLINIGRILFRFEIIPLANDQATDSLEEKL
ncbi:MAG TPA: FHA domain-containing protein [Longilinea sp.]|nr:FHA domain-containing protein [Longilinea sp.]